MCGWLIVLSSSIRGIHVSDLTILKEKLEQEVKISLTTLVFDDEWVWVFSLEL